MNEGKYSVVLPPGGGTADIQMLNQAHTAGSAIAAFQLAQFSFAALVNNGIVSKIEAEKMLKQAIAANETAGPGNRAAAVMLDGVLRALSAFRPITRQ